VFASPVRAIEEHRKQKAAAIAELRSQNEALLSTIFSQRAELDARDRAIALLRQERETRTAQRKAEDSNDGNSIEDLLAGPVTEESSDGFALSPLLSSSPEVARGDFVEGFHHKQGGVTPERPQPPPKPAQPPSLPPSLSTVDAPALIRTFVSTQPLHDVLSASVQSSTGVRQIRRIDSPPEKFAAPSASSRRSSSPGMPREKPKRPRRPQPAQKPASKDGTDTNTSLHRAHLSTTLDSVNSRTRPSRKDANASFATTLTSDNEE
jgi:hypothetical protein